MRKLLVVALLAATTLLTEPALAQVPCSVSTDKSTYTVGESVFVSGSGEENSSATITVSDGTPLGTVPTEPSTGSFSAVWDAANATAGTQYTINVTMADGATCSSASFTFVVEEPPPSEEPEEPAEPGDSEDPDSPQELSKSEKCKCPRGGTGGGTGGTGETPAPSGELPFTGIPVIWLGGLGLLLLTSGLALTRRNKS